MVMERGAPEEVTPLSVTNPTSSAHKNTFFSSPTSAKAASIPLRTLTTFAL